MTKNDKEVDLIIQKPNKELIFVEIKSKENVTADDCKILQSFIDINTKIKGYVFSTDSISKKIGSVYCLHWQEGLQELGLD